MKTRVIRLGVLCAVLAALLAVLGRLSLQGAGLPCPVYDLTGLYCPGCGTGRALGSLLRLDPAAALGYNALAVVLLPVPVALLGAQAVRYVRGLQAGFSRTEKYVAMGLVVVFLLFGVLRNLPLFAYLAPGLE